MSWIYLWTKGTHGLLVETKSKHPVHKTLKTEYIVQASTLSPGQQSGGVSIVYLKALIPKLCELCENFIRYKTEDTVAKHIMSRGTVTLVGLLLWYSSNRVRAFDPRVRTQGWNEWSVWHGSGEHTARAILYDQELNISPSRIIEYHFLNSGHWPQLHWCPRKF